MYLDWKEIIDLTVRPHARQWAKTIAYVVVDAVGTTAWPIMLQLAVTAGAGPLGTMYVAATLVAYRMRGWGGKKASHETELIGIAAKTALDKAAVRELLTYASPSSKISQAEVTQVLDTHISQLWSVVRNNPRNLMRSSLYALGVIVAPFITGPLFGVASVGSALLLACSSTVLLATSLTLGLMNVRKEKALHDQATREHTDVVAQRNDLGRDNAFDLRGLGAEEMVADKHEQLQSALTKTLTKLQTLGRKTADTLSWVSLLGLATPWVLDALGLVSLSRPQLATLSILASTLDSSSRELVDYLGTLVWRTRTSAEKLHKLLGGERNGYVRSLVREGADVSVGTPKEHGLDLSGPLVIAFENVMYKFVDKDGKPTGHLYVHCTFQVTDGIITIRGVSGGGKTTLMNLLVGGIQPTSGRVVVRDRHGKEASPDKIPGFVTRTSEALADVTPDVEYDGKGHLEENTVGRALKLARGKHDSTSDGEQLDALVKSALLNRFVDKRGLDAAGAMGSSRVEKTDHQLQTEFLDLVKRHTDDMSKGERDRLAIAVCMLAKSKVIAIDEFAGRLDPVTASELDAGLRMHVEKTRALVIRMSHGSREFPSDESITVSRIDNVSTLTHHVPRFSARPSGNHPLTSDRVIEIGDSAVTAAFRDAGIVAVRALPDRDGQWQRTPLIKLDNAVTTPPLTTMQMASRLREAGAILPDLGKILAVLDHPTGAFRDANGLVSPRDVLLQPLYHGRAFPWFVQVAEHPGPNTVHLPTDGSYREASPLALAKLDRANGIPPLTDFGYEFQ